MDPVATKPAARPAWREPMVWLVVAIPLAAVVASTALLVSAARSTGNNDAVTDQVRRTAQIQVEDLAPDLAARELQLAATVSVEGERISLQPDGGDFPRDAELHLSLQHGDDMILKRMKRRHSSADARAFADEVRRLRPEISLGADMIAGFPTETEEMFENAARLAEDCGIAHLHVFPYSPRPGTPAARMPQLDRGLIKDRAARLRAVGAALYARHLDGMGYEVTTGIGPDLMTGAREAVLRMIDLLTAEHGYSPVDAYMLCSVCGDLRISEIVDMPNWVVSFYFPRIVLA